MGKFFFKCPISSNIIVDYRLWEITYARAHPVMSYLLMATIAEVEKYFFATYLVETWHFLYCILNVR